MNQMAFKINVLGPEDAKRKSQAGFSEWKRLKERGEAEPEPVKKTKKARIDSKPKTKPGASKRRMMSEWEARGFVSRFLQYVAEGKTKDVRRVLGMGLDPNARNADGWTALMKAAEGGHMETAEFLIKMGAEVDARNHLGTTALNRAISGGHVDTVGMLLEHGADANARSGFGRSMLQSVRDSFEFGHPELEMVLRRYGAK